MSKNVESNSFTGVSMVSSLSTSGSSNFSSIVSVEVIMSIGVPVSVDRCNVVLSRVSITDWTFIGVTVVSSVSYVSSSDFFSFYSVEVILSIWIPVSVNSY